MNSVSEQRTAAPSDGIDTGTHAWRQIVPGGDCQCADGGKFSFWERQADPTRVVLFLNGGGVCWDAKMYSPNLTVQHRGYVNGTAALDYLATHYPSAAQVVVIGKTAGSIAAPLFGGLVADRLPHAKVTVFGAQSGAVPAWAVDGLTVRNWGIPRFWSKPPIIICRKPLSPPRRRPE